MLLLLLPGKAVVVRAGPAREAGEMGWLRRTGLLAYWLLLAVALRACAALRLRLRSSRRPCGLLA